MLTVGLVGRKQPSFLRDSSTLQQGRWGSIEPTSAAKTRLQRAHILTKRLSWWNMTVATRWAALTGCLSPPTGAGFQSGKLSPTAGESIVGSGFVPSPRLAALRRPVSRSD